tara:strand:- start:10533 stop:11744 length:1212 start_codon:yes stop_codon:yes gene_type:complete
LIDYKHFVSDVYLAESEIQNFFYKKKKKQANNFGYIPNLYAYEWVISSSLFNIILFILKIMWPIVLILFNVITLVIYIVKKIRLACVREKGEINDSILFASSDAAVKLYDKAVVDECTIVFRPGRMDCNEKEMQSSFDALQIIGFYCLFCVLLKATYISLFLGYNSKYSEYRFLSFYVFELLVVSESLKALNSASLKKQLFVTDHYDRWALMADYLREVSYSKLTIIQHGVLAVGETSFDVLIPKKLSGVDSLYFFDELSKAVFIEKIFSPSLNPRFVNFNNGLELTALDVDCPSILIVGCPVSFDFHLALSDYINLNIDEIKIFYKPHPTSIGYGRSKNKHWVWVDDVDYFPEVDLVISYPSSLATQYQSKEIPVFIHEIDETGSAVYAAYSHIYSYLESVL